MPLPSVPPMIPRPVLADPKTIYLMWCAGNTGARAGQKLSASWHSSAGHAAAAMAAAVGLAVPPLNPAAFLEPGHRVRQPALAVGRCPRQLCHAERPVRRLGQVHEDLVVTVRQTGVASELRIGRGEDRLARLQEQAPGALFLLGEPACGHGHVCIVPHLVERLTSHLGYDTR